MLAVVALNFLLDVTRMDGAIPDTQYIHRKFRYKSENSSGDKVAGVTYSGIVCMMPCLGFNDSTHMLMSNYESDRLQVLASLTSATCAEVWLKPISSILDRLVLTTVSKK